MHTILLLLVFAIWPDNTLDSDAYVVPQGSDCHAMAVRVIRDWKQRDPTIDRFVAACKQAPDPREVTGQEGAPA